MLLHWLGLPIKLLKGEYSYLILDLWSKAISLTLLNMTLGEKWNISGHISKLRMSQSSATATTKGCELVSPEETQDVKTQDTSPRLVKYISKE